MISSLIGITTALLLIIINRLKQFDNKIIYGLTLASIGFLYVGFTWTNMNAIILASIQAVFFLLFAYYGISKSLYILVIGYFLHGLWDISYNLWQDAALIPPHYDWFCLSFDFTVGIYLLIHIQKQKNRI
jgi:hypothetical protein